MNSFLIVLKALFKNKLRFGESTTKNKKFLMFALFGVVYALFMYVLITLIISLTDFFEAFPMFKVSAYFFMLIIACGIVLAFGIIAIITTLYLSKDTDFYSALPIKHTTVFFAKMSFIYLTELAIVLVVLFPLAITFGIVAHVWGWFYIISFIGMLIVPAIPLGVASLLAIPVMYIGSKLKNRSIVSVVFSCVLFGGFAALYFYAVFAMPDAGDMDASTANAVGGIVDGALGYALYPLVALSFAACGVPSYGLSAASSALANVGIFIGIAVALFAVLWLAGKFMYAQSVKANNQTDNSKAKKSDFKSAGSFRALIKREYLGTLLTNQVAFQCYAVMLLPVICAVVFGLSISRAFGIATEGGVEVLNSRFVAMLIYGTLLIMFGTLSNGAATSFSREGSTIASLKVLPISAKRIFWSKLAAWILLAMPMAAISVIVGSIFNFDIVSLLLALFSLVPISGLYAAFGMLWDLNRPKLKWTDPMQAVKHNWHVATGQFICMGAGLLVLVIIVAMLQFCSLNTVTIVFWSLIYSIVIIFAVVDIILYKNIDEYYNRIEI